MTTVLNVAYPLHPVSNASAGGAEQILHLLEERLAQHGVRSLVVATEGSQITGTLFASPDTAKPIGDEEREAAQWAHRNLIERVLQNHQVDLVHYHGLDFASYCLGRDRKNIKQMATVHLPPSWYADDALSNHDVSLVCVSRSQARDLPDCKRVIENGINVEQFSGKRHYGGPLLWLGRVCPEKGAHLALQIAHRCGEEITLAGPVQPFASHQRYFDEQILPLLDSRRRYVGAVNLRQKRELLLEAKALLLPSLAPETSSLVAMEAAASGLPVIGFRSGALPEVIEQGITGFVVEDVDNMIQALDQIEKIDSNTCRSRAQVRFAADRMTSDYVDFYRHLING